MGLKMKRVMTIKANDGKTKAEIRIKYQSSVDGFPSFVERDINQLAENAFDSLQKVGFTLKEIKVK